MGVYTLYLGSFQLDILREILVASFFWNLDFISTYNLINSDSIYPLSREPKLLHCQAGRQGDIEAHLDSANFWTTNKMHLPCVICDILAGNQRAQFPSQIVDTDRNTQLPLGLMPQNKLPRTMQHTGLRNLLYWIWIFPWLLAARILFLVPSLWFFYSVFWPLFTGFRALGKTC